MVQYLFDKNVVIYTFAVLCGIGLIIRLMVNAVYKHLVKESDNLGETKNKMLKHIKLKFETCFKLKIGVNNVDTFVDKNVLRYRFCGVLLSTWDNLGGQVLFLNLLIVPVCAIFGVAENCGQDQILFMGAVGMLSSAVLILVDKSINLTGKRRMLRLNLLDYLENFCKVRLEQEVYQPEVFEQYRRDFLQASEANKQISAAAEMKKAEPKDELKRRREVRHMKEEERKLQAAKREEEQRKLEEARKEEERKKIEERRQLAARRREEDRMKLEEEKQALELRREQMKKKAEEKQQANEKKQHKAEEKNNVLHSIEEELKPTEEKNSVSSFMKSLEEIAADREQAVLIKAEKDQVVKETANKEKQNKAVAGVGKIQAMTPQEEKLIEDVLKEFFA